MRRNRQPRHSDDDVARSAAGFVLIDVLVTLAIVSVIASLMVVFVGQARTIVRIRAAVESQMEVEAAARFLEAAIGNAEPLPLIYPLTEVSEEVRYLDGGGSTLKFSGIQPSGFGASALRQITIILRDRTSSRGEQLGDLWMQREKRQTASDGKLAEEIEVLTGVKDLEFEYLGDGDKAQPEWSSTWSMQRRLPNAIRFRLTIVRDGVMYMSTGLARLELAEGIARIDPTASEPARF